MMVSFDVALSWNRKYKFNFFLLVELVLGVLCSFSFTIPLYAQQPAQAAQAAQTAPAARAAPAYINYCKLISLGEHYGQMIIQYDSLIPEREVLFFNMEASAVFLNHTSIRPISSTEFIVAGIYDKDNKASFPQDQMYHPSQSSAYIIFHIAKELYYIHQNDPGCSYCDSTSLNSLNDLLINSLVWKNFCETGRTTRDLNRRLALSEVKDLDHFLHCYYFDQFVNPMARREELGGPILNSTGDTIEVTCADQIKIKPPQIAYPCKTGGQINALHNGTPYLKSGKPNCPGAIYAYGFELVSACGRDTGYQYFKIINKKTSIQCAADIMVQCYEQIAAVNPKVSISCGLGFQITSDPPKLIKGKPRCNGSQYMIRYTVHTACDEDLYCQQKFTIRHPIAVLECLPDTLVECKKYIPKDTPKVKLSCPLSYKLFIKGPTLISGKEDCPGTTYRMEYVLTDSCGNKVICHRKFTIKPTPATLVCPPDTIVSCADDISMDFPPISSTCGITIVPNKPILKKLAGESNCPGTKYEMEYTAVDACGRKLSCRRIFTIADYKLTVTCPPDVMVNCYDDINKAILLHSEIEIKDAPCGRHPDNFPGAPILISGKDKCPGAVYQVLHNIHDSCGQKTLCHQTYTIRDFNYEIFCPKNKIVRCVEDIVAEHPVLRNNCGLGYHVESSSPKWIPGEPPYCPGAEYEIRYLITDSCGFRHLCLQRFTLGNSDWSLICPSDTIVSRLEDIRPSIPTVINACRYPYPIQYSDAQWEKGAPPGCSGSVYKIIYTVSDSCGNKAKCTQRFTLKLPTIDIDCPRDTSVKCKDDIIIQTNASWLFGSHVEIRTDGPNLIRGLPDCSGSVYQVIYRYIVNCTDTVICQQIFFIQNQAPAIVCPPDQTISTLSELLPQNYTIQVACNMPYRVDKIGPDCISGNPGEPGSQYYVTYIVTDSCRRQARCTSKLTLVGLGTDPHTPCPYPAQWFGTLPTLAQDPRDRFHQDIANFLNNKTCKWLESKVLNGINDFYSEWANELILGNTAGLARDIANRGHIQSVLSKLDEINLAIEAIEAAINGDADGLKDLLVPEMLTRMATRLAGNGTPAAVLTTLNVLGDFSKYLDEDILRINLDLYAEWAKSDPQFFYADHFLKKYARIEDLKTGNRESWDRLKIHQTLVVYSTYKLMNNIQIPEAKEIWKSQANLNAIRVVTRAMLDEVCVLFHEKIKLRNQLNRLKREQKLIERFKAVWTYFLQFRCPPCADILNVSIVQTSPGVLDCQCLSPYKWSPDRTACVPVDPCLVPNAQQVFFNNRYKCDCVPGFKWNSTHTQCLRSIPDCNTQLANSKAVWNPNVNDYECRCVQGYTFNLNTGHCELTKPNCPDPHAEAVWNSTVNAFECQCLPGYEFNININRCEPEKPHCQDVYAEPVWNVNVNAYECHCIQGYEFNTQTNRCEVSKPQCQDAYAEPVWNSIVNAYECHCIQGFQYNLNSGKCEAAIPDCNTFYSNTEPVWDPVKKEFVCACIKGFIWNTAGNGCVQKDPVNPIGVITSIIDALTSGGNTGTANPPVRPENQKTGNCNQQYGSGTNEP